MKIMLDAGAFEPIREHETDAGLDLRAKEEKLIPARGSAVIGTGVHVELPDGCAGLLVSKSGLNVKHGLTSTGLIDQGYTGEVMVKLYNHSVTSYQVHAGDKISQLVVIPVRYEPVEIVDRIDGAGNRGDNGFGSTGKREGGNKNESTDNYWEFNQGSGYADNTKRRECLQLYSGGQ